MPWAKPSQRSRCKIAEPPPTVPLIDSTVGWLLQQRIGVDHDLGSPKEQLKPTGWAPASAANPSSPTESISIESTAQVLRGIFAALDKVAPATRMQSEQAARECCAWLLSAQATGGEWHCNARPTADESLDRFSAGRTAEVLRTIHRWKSRYANAPDWQPVVTQLPRAVERATRFLARAMHENGSWSSCQFGSPLHEENDSRVLGTARVLQMCTEVAGDAPLTDELASRGVEFLLRSEAVDGGWGPAPAAPELAAAKHGKKTITSANLNSCEETAAAILALVPFAADQAVRDAIDRGINWLELQWNNRQTVTAGITRSELLGQWTSDDIYPTVYSYLAGQAYSSLNEQPSHLAIKA